jgi:hypothetical protein
MNDDADAVSVMLVGCESVFVPAVQVSCAGRRFEDSRQNAGNFG